MHTHTHTQVQSYGLQEIEGNSFLLCNDLDCLLLTYLAQHLSLCQPRPIQSLPHMSQS